jgi:hypothetical protein
MITQFDTQIHSDETLGAEWEEFMDEINKEDDNAPQNQE